MVITLILFFLLLSVIITIHEAGHLFAAKKFGVYCYEFSFGMGPVIFKRQKGETQYSIRALPIGGFVAMAGEQDGDEAYPDVHVPEGRRLTEQKWWKKVIIMLAGVFMNFVLAYAIFVGIALAAGGVQMSPEPVVGSVVASSPAEQAGFEAGDRIIKITAEDGSSVKPKTFLDMQSFNTEGQACVYTVERDGQTLELTVTPAYDEESGAYLIGITSVEGKYVKVTPANCLYFGGYYMVTMTRLMFQAIGTIFHGSGLKQLSGPVGIYKATGQAASMGFSSYMLLIAELSLNVGIFNLLPLPVLDGGQVVITLGEAICRHKLNEKVKTGLMLGCWALLIVLMVFVTWKDIASLFA
ncbi:MAG: RIP metalloprotease RseP [Lactimicrobium massiliense]|nr:RIP metalloprotease RseP [Lactimicrobium massiliense]MDD6560188.1 RIP metalloprotease RseP [Lactimicrobium massiliense]